MVAAETNAIQENVRRLLLITLGRSLVVAALGISIGLGTIAGLRTLDAPASSDRLCWLCLLISVQVVCLLASVQSRNAGPELGELGRACLMGIAVMLVATLLGIGYDVMVRWLGGAPAMGPWGAARELEPASASALIAWGVLGGSAADERFFRAGLFSTWQDAGRPWTGALLSSALFALSRFDPLNLPAYFGLGLVLCGVYRWTHSLRAVWIGHGLLNAAMFAMLFCGYE